MFLDIYSLLYLKSEQLSDKQKTLWYQSEKDQGMARLEEICINRPMIYRLTSKKKEFSYFQHDTGWENANPQ